MTRPMVWEFALMDFIQAHLRSPAGDWLMVAFTVAGEFGMVWIALSLVLLCFKDTRRCAVWMLFALLATFLVGEVFLKNVICRVRPCNLNPTLEMLVPRPESYSFPSGHAGSSFAAAWMLFRCHKKLGTAALVLGGCIAFSRVYVYVHFPTDILAGAVLGILMAELLYFLSKRYGLIARKFPHS